MGLRHPKVKQVAVDSARYGRVSIEKSVYILDADRWAVGMEAVIEAAGSLTEAAKSLNRTARLMKLRVRFDKSYLSRLRKAPVGRRIQEVRLEALRVAAPKVRVAAGRPARGPDDRPAPALVQLLRDAGAALADDASWASIGEAAASLLRSAVMTPAVQQVFIEHREWVAEALAPFGLSEWVLTVGLPSTVRAGDYWKDHSDPYAAAPKRGRVRANWDALEALYQDQGKVGNAFGQLAEFERQILERGYGNAELREEWRIRRCSHAAVDMVRFLEPRGVLAVTRALEPIVRRESLRPGAVPRSMFELSWGQLRNAGHLDQFLNVSAQRELMLLDREPDMIVAQRTGHFLRSGSPIPLKTRVRHTAGAPPVAVSGGGM